MARNKALKERVKELVAELLAEEIKVDGPSENINDIEDTMVRIGDMVACEVGVQKLAAHTGQLPKDPRCPDCGRAGKHRGERSRDIITRRGEVPLTEVKYRCSKCRRLFFPSDGPAGIGGTLRLHAADVSAHRLRLGAGSEF